MAKRRDKPYSKEASLSTLRQRKDGSGYTVTDSSKATTSIAVARRHRPSSQLSGGSRLVLVCGVSHRG